MSDIFVEGSTDKYVVRRLLDEALPFGTAILCPDDVEIDAFVPTGIDGARGRVVQICDHAVDKTYLRTFGLVDRNFSGGQNSEANPNLYYTLTDDLEFDIFDVSSLSSILSDTYSKVISHEDVKSAVNIARIIQHVRRLGYQSGYPIELPKISKIVSISNGAVRLDVGQLASRMGALNGHNDQWSNFVNVAVEVINDLGPDTGSKYLGFHVLENTLTFLLHEKYSIASNLLLNDWLGRIIRGHMNLSAAQSMPFVDLLAKINA